MLPRTSPESFLANHEVTSSAPCAGVTSQAGAERAQGRRLEDMAMFAVVAFGTLGSWCAGTWLLQNWLLA
jgi:hypothetical protein